jgi:D-arabinose 1-dehydrogenase-like Zn-dependent alcohol dehydrogenase
MRAVQVSRPGGPFEIVDREIPEPGAGSVRIKVQACGICHSDSYTKEGLFPGIVYPRVPGHEVVGIVDAIGPGVGGWAPGQRAGVGWNGGYCGYCDSCRRGDLFACQTATYITGITSDGGYADYIIARAEALARVPDELSAVEAAPLMCAGITTYNCLRNSGARPGEVVAVLGLGGLGHLGVQFAAKMGFKTIAIARGQDKGALAGSLGAWRYVDTQGHPRYRDGRRSHGGRPGRTRRKWADDDRWRGAETRDISPSTPPGTERGRRLVFRHFDRFAGYTLFQRAGGRAFDE